MTTENKVIIIGVGEVPLGERLAHKAYENQRNHSNMKQEIKPEFSQGYVSGTALGDLQILRHAIQAAKYMAWDMKLDSPGGEKALEIMDEFHSGKYGSKDGIWVQAKNAIDALEKLLKQDIKPDPENTDNPDKIPFDDSYLGDVMRCGLTESEYTERELLLERQRSITRWFSQQEFDRLKELSAKMFANAGSPHST